MDEGKQKTTPKGKGKSGKPYEPIGISVPAWSTYRGSSYIS
jgi:hypothetical protein